MTKVASTPGASDSKRKTLDGRPRPDDSSRADLQALRVGHELIDTTWRIAVPVVLFAGLGIVADRSVGSEPWITLTGTIVGFMFAARLVQNQIQRWPAKPVKPGSYERNRRVGDKSDDEKDYYND